jgi:hypothetical protein
MTEKRQSAGRGWRNLYTGGGVWRPVSPSISQSESVPDFSSESLAWSPPTRMGLVAVPLELRRGSMDRRLNRNRLRSMGTIGGGIHYDGGSSALGTAGTCAVLLHLAAPRPRRLPRALPRPPLAVGDGLAARPLPCPTPRRCALCRSREACVTVLLTFGRHALN